MDSIFAFSQLSNYDNLMHLNTNDDAMYQSFYNYNVNRNMGKFQKVSNYLSDSAYWHINEARAINQSITPNGILEENEKTVNTIYLNKLSYESDTLNGAGAHYVFDSTEVSQLRSVANQQPLFGGSAVYKARVLLWMEAPNNTANNTRSPIKMIPKKTDTKQSSYKLYPNPNSGTMTLEYDIEGSETAQFSIYDMSGRLVKQLILNANNKTAIINANELNAGIYYYDMKDGVNAPKANKLIIIK